MAYHEILAPDATSTTTDEFPGCGGTYLAAHKAGSWGGGTATLEIEVRPGLWLPDEKTRFLKSGHLRADTPPGCQCRLRLNGVTGVEILYMPLTDNVNI